MKSNAAKAVEPQTEEVNIIEEVRAMAPKSISFPDDYTDGHTQGYQDALDDVVTLLEQKFSK